jgi:hypothetical protein
MKNMLENISNAFIVIYTDNENYQLIQDMRKPFLNKTKIIIKEIKDFYVSQYTDKFIENQKKNIYLNNVSYKLNLIWNEKINFVKETIENNYFDTNYYCWCDIGYFRCEYNTISIEDIKTFPNNNNIKDLDKDKIYYGLVNNNLNELREIINDRDANDLSKIEISPLNVTIAGGFFILHKNKINYWFETYYDLLNKYISNNRLIKDDQIIIIDCILNKKNENNFKLIESTYHNFNNWFVFSKFLL